MPLAELLPAVKALPRDEKIELLHLLEREFADPEGDPVARVATAIPPGTTFDVWKPDLDVEGQATLDRFVASMPRHP